MCGEDFAFVERVNMIMRFTPTCVGKTLQSTHPAEWRRFTPTCVGKTNSFSAIAVELWVHPHVCGEDHNKLSAG